MLSEFTKTKMETLEKPTEVMTRMDQVNKEQPQVGGTVEGEKKHVVVPKKLEQGYIKERWMPEDGATRVPGQISRFVPTISSDWKMRRISLRDAPAVVAKPDRQTL